MSSLSVHALPNKAFDFDLDRDGQFCIPGKTAASFTVTTLKVIPLKGPIRAEDVEMRQPSTFTVGPIGATNNPRDIVFERAASRNSDRKDTLADIEHVSGLTLAERSPTAGSGATTLADCDQSPEEEMTMDSVGSTSRLSDELCFEGSTVIDFDGPSEGFSNQSVGGGRRTVSSGGSGMTSKSSSDLSIIDIEMPTPGLIKLQSTLWPSDLAEDIKLIPDVPHVKEMTSGVNHVRELTAPEVNYGLAPDINMSRKSTVSIVTLNPHLYVNYPDDKRPSYKLPRRKTSRASADIFSGTSWRELFCCTKTREKNIDMEQPGRS